MGQPFHNYTKQDDDICPDESLSPLLSLMKQGAMVGDTHDKALKVASDWQPAKLKALSLTRRQTWMLPITWV